MYSIKYQLNFKATHNNYVAIALNYVVCANKIQFKAEILPNLLDIKTLRFLKSLDLMEQKKTENIRIFPVFLQGFFIKCY